MDQWILASTNQIHSSYKSAQVRYLITRHSCIFFRVSLNILIIYLQWREIIIIKKSSFSVLVWIFILTDIILGLSLMHVKLWKISEVAQVLQTMWELLPRKQARQLIILKGTQLHWQREDTRWLHYTLFIFHLFHTSVQTRILNIPPVPVQISTAIFVKLTANTRTKKNPMSPHKAQLFSIYS